MKIGIGLDKHFYLYFKNEMEAMRWEWLFCNVLHRQYACYGQYCNAFKLF